MVAVNLSRLRKQIDEVISTFKIPEAFYSQIKNLFNLYANNAYRHGESSQPTITIPIFHLPQPMLRLLQLELTPLIARDAETALSIADKMWEDPYLEVKQLAIFIMGTAPIDEPDLVLSRLESWLSPDLDNALKSYLFSKGTLMLQNTFFEAWVGFVTRYLEHQDPEKTALGLRMLKEGLKNPNFENLPAVFRLISPILKNPQPDHVTELELLVKELALTSPTETAHFLRQTYFISPTPDLSWLIKQCLSSFPESTRQNLKSILKK